MVDHHAALGCDGLFLAGTCGEGPWMTASQTRELVTRTVDANRGRMGIAVQVTENSVSRVLNQIEQVCTKGVDIAVVAQPSMFMNATPARVVKFYTEIFDRSPLPIGFYDRGDKPGFPLNPAVLSEIYAHPAVRIVKDSSVSEEHLQTALAARAKRPELVLLSGDEFQGLHYLSSGYDGLLTGGAILSTAYLKAMGAAFAAGDLEKAKQIDERTKKMLFAVYGGEKIACWLTGLKYTLAQLGIFGTSASHLEYPLTDECRAAIHCVLEEDAELLKP
jgi:dihydrodipicolinate synthase/N-acetylneuraminate lyase